MERSIGKQRRINKNTKGDHFTKANYSIIIRVNSIYI